MGELQKVGRAWRWFGPGRAYLMSGRQWSFNRDGRRFSARWMRHRFLLSVEAEVAQPFQLGRDNALARGAGSALGRARQDLADGVVAFGPDAQALEAFLAAPAVEEAARTLCADDGQSLRAVALVPGDRVELTARWLQPPVLAENAEALLAALVVLAEAGEGVGAS